MRDIGAIVSEQSPIIAGVEERVSAANDNIVSGNRELQGASRSQVISVRIIEIELYMLHVLSFRKNIERNFVGF